MDASAATTNMFTQSGAQSGGNAQANAFAQQGVQNIGNVARALQGGLFATVVAGGTLGTSIGTAAGTVLTLSTTQQVVFHNLSLLATIYISPTIDANGQVIALSSTVTAGSFTVLPQMDRVMTLGSGSWLGIATITGTFLTIGLALGL